MPFDPDFLAQRFRQLAPAADYCSLRVVEERSESISVRQDHTEPVTAAIDHGAMVTAIDGDGIGYAATSDLSDAGLRWALARATEWAHLARGRSVFAGRAPQFQPPHGRYASPTVRPMHWTKAERIDLLMRESQACRLSDRIVDWQASLWTISTQQLLLTADSRADQVALQTFDFTIPSLHVVAHGDGVTQTRSWGGRSNGLCQQGGLEVIERSGFVGSGIADRRRSAAIVGGAELSEWPHGHRVDARSDDAADPRVDWPSARARSHSRR